MLTQMQVETMVHDVVYTAKVCKLTSGETQNRFLSCSVFSKYNNGKFKNTRYLRDFAQGYFRALINEIYRNELEFCYQDVDGCLYSTWKDSKWAKTSYWYDQGKGSYLGTLQGRHYWRGTRKVWY